MKKLLSVIGRFFAQIGGAIGRFFARGGRALAALFRKPKWRHGSYGAILLAGFAAVCVLVNVAVQSLETNYGWRKDFSFNGYATTGEETRKIVDALTDDVTLYLLYQSGDMDSQLYEVLARYALLSEHITVEPTDIARNPGILSRFQGDLNTTLEADSVIVSCEARDRYKILSYSDFVTQGYNADAGTFEIAGLAYEKNLTEAIVYVTEETVPMIGVMQGHGELNSESLTNLLTFLQSNNYDSKEVDLLNGDTLDGVDLLMIADPQKDFSAEEITAIQAFAEGGGSLFVIRDYTDPLELPNYRSLLNNYGVTPLAGVVVAGEEDTGSYYGERIYLLPTFCTLDMTQPLIDGKLDSLLLAGASAFATPSEGDSLLSAAAVLKSGPNAYLRDPSDGNNTIDKQDGDPTGEQTLAVISARMHATGEVSRMFAIGNSTVFTDEYIYQRFYSEEFVLQVMSELLPQKNISLDIMASSAFHPGLTVGSRTMGVALLITLPLLALLAAACVLIPRRNR